MSPATHRTDEQQERLNRQLTEVLQEVRIAMPGVQVLFAFLLAVPFAEGFDDVSEFGQDVYLFALLTAAVSSAVLIAPTAYHRIMFERGDKERIIRYAATCALAGLGLLALSMSASILLVTNALFGAVEAAISTGLMAGVFAWLWFGFAWSRRRR